jgi:hypothetical protein
MVCGDISTDRLHEKIEASGDMFDLAAETWGFHDCEYTSSSGIVRGFYSYIEPFEIEQLVEGITTKTLHKRIKSCEFISDGTAIFVFGNQGARKLLSAALSALTGNHIEIHNFEFEDLSRIQNCMKAVKSVSVMNPNDKEVRTCRMTGRIEEYTDYNVIDKKNHGISSVSGMIDTPFGPMTITVGKKGAIRLNVRKGMIATFDLLRWILDLIIGKNNGVAVASAEEIHAAAKKIRDELDAKEAAASGETQPELPFGTPEEIVICQPDPNVLLSKGIVSGYDPGRTEPG